MVRGLQNPTVHRQDGPPQICWLPGDAGLRADLETSMLRDDRVGADPGHLCQGHGYITRDGFCPCGASLATHEDRTCPGATKNPRAADERLLDSLLGRRRLTLMKRMGRIPFIGI